MANRMRMVSIIQSVVQEDNQTNYKNTFSNDSNSTAAVYLETGTLKAVTVRDGKGIVEDIVDNIFDANIGVANISSSQPSLTDIFERYEEMDERLKRWQDTLRDRMKMQERIYRKTGKKPNEMLFNLPASVEQRDRGTVNRLMDFASRMNPMTLKQKLPEVLPARVDMRTGMCIPQLQETLPQAERSGETAVEICGLPNSTKREILCPARAFTGPSPNQNSKWLNSKELEKQILEKDEDIGRVLEYCPDISELEVVGNNNLNVCHNEDISLLHSEDVYTVSSSTDSTVLESPVKCKAGAQQQSPPEDITVGIKINDKVYTADYKRNPPIGDLQFHFECEPYQIQAKEVLRFENVGKKVMICDWSTNYESFKRSNDWEDCHKCFLFDHKLIILFPGEVYISKALFQPCVVSRSKQTWELKTFPNLFCIPRAALVVHFIGKCLPSSMYSDKINRSLQFVIDKSNDQIIRKLTTQHAKLAPHIESPGMLYPCERDLDDRELFNALNVGYHCERFEDLEDLRALHTALKMPRAPVWDLRLETIKKIILGLPLLEFRETYFKKFIDILESMKSCGDIQFSTFDHSQERKRTRFIYVRGCISNGIEEWEELMISIEKTCLKSALVSFYSGFLDKPESEKISAEDKKQWLKELQNESLEMFLLKELRGNKYYRDSLYIQTYTLLCDISENMVSIIESTEFI